MAATGTAIAAPAPAGAAPKAPAGGKAAAALKRRRFRLLGIGSKLTAFTVLLFGLVIIAVGYSLFRQQRQSLTREVLSRGRTIAQNLASAYGDVILTKDTLAAQTLATGAVEQRKEDMFLRRGHDLGSPSDWMVGILAAFQDLRISVPSLLEQELDSLAGTRLNLGWIVPASSARSIVNEGIAEAIIVDNTGMIVAHYLGTSELGKPYQEPAYVSQPTAEAPYPVYEMESFVDGRRFVRRLYRLKQDILVKTPEGIDKQVGTVYIGEDEDLVNSVVFDGTMKLAAVAIAAVLISVVVTLLLVTFLTAPIGRLVKGVLATAAGDFNTRVRVASRDELGELSSAFNAMAVSLSQNELLKGAFARYVSDAALKQVLADPSATGLHGRRVLATIYTSDVRGFTAMSETLEPEQVVQVINTYLSLQTDIVLKNGGVVDKFIGDATVGVWGKETQDPDDAFHAVRAALEVQQAIAAMNVERAARGEIVKEIGIGVNTGEVVSGNMGSSRKMEYTVTGEHVIFADQICAECPGGKVWVSNSTYNLVKDRVLAEPVELKGRGHETAAWQVNALK